MIRPAIGNIMQSLVSLLIHFALNLAVKIPILQKCSKVLHVESRAGLAPTCTLQKSINSKTFVTNHNSSNHVTKI